MPWTIARQAPLSMGFSRQECWSGLLCPPPGYLPNPGIELTSVTSPALAGGFFTTSATWEAPYFFVSPACFALGCLWSYYWFLEVYILFLILLDIYVYCEYFLKVLFSSLVLDEYKFCFSKILFICLFIFGCTESSLLCKAFLQLWCKGATVHCGAWASHCRGFSCCRAQALERAGFSSCSGWALKHRLRTCGLWAQLPLSMWDLPRPRIKPALQGKLLTTRPKSSLSTSS